MEYKYFSLCSVILLFLTSYLFTQEAIPARQNSKNSNDSLYITEETKSSEEIIAEFSGNNIQSTRPFTANSSWEVQWEFEGEIFQIYLQSPKEELWEVLANQSGSGSGTSYYPKRGEYYFKVNAMGNWKIKVINVQ